MSKRFARLEDVPRDQRKRSTAVLHRGDFVLRMTPARERLLGALIEGGLLEAGFRQHAGRWYAHVERLPNNEHRRRPVTRPVGDDVMLAMRWSSPLKPMLSVSDDQNVSPGPRLWELWTHPTPIWIPMRSDVVIVGLTQAGKERAKRLLDEKPVDFYAGDRSPERLRA